MPKILKRNCNVCGKYYESQNIKYCGHKCAVQGFSDNHPTSAHMLINCETCNKEFKIPYTQQGKKRFCSIECRDIADKKPKVRDGYGKKQGTAQTKFANIAKRAKRRGWDCCSVQELISFYQIENKQCAYCDITETEWIKLFNGKHNRFGLEIDRKDNAVGYTIDNIVWCCHRCNVTKNEYLSFEDMREVAQKYFKHRWQTAINEMR